MSQQQFSSGRSEDDDQSTSETTAPQPSTQGSTEDLDSLLDEIDTVLESNAEEFVSGFVQKGGQ